MIEVLISKALIDSDISHDEFYFSSWCVELIQWHEKGIQKSW